MCTLNKRAERFGLISPICLTCEHHSDDGREGPGWCEIRGIETDLEDRCEMWMPDFWRTIYAPPLNAAGTCSQQALDEAVARFRKVVSQVIEEEVG